MASCKHTLVGVYSGMDGGGADPGGGGGGGMALVRMHVSFQGDPILGTILALHTPTVTMAFEAAIGASLAAWTEQLAKMTSVSTVIVERVLVFTAGATVASVIYWSLHESKIIQQHRLKVVSKLVLQRTGTIAHSYGLLQEAAEDSTSKQKVLSLLYSIAKDSANRGTPPLARSQL